MFLPSNGAQDSLNKIAALASAMQAGEGDEILAAVGALRTSLSDIVALVRHSLVGNSYIAEAKGHRSKGASVSDALRRLADAIDGARPGDSVASLADRLAKAEQRLDYLDGEPAERGQVVAVPKRMAGSPQPTMLRQLLTDALSYLEGWAEPSGHLVPSEPDREERARIRISLRGLITGYMIALGEDPPRRQFEKDDLRDRLRIAEAAIADQEAARG